MIQSRGVTNKQHHIFLELNCTTKKLFTVLSYYLTIAVTVAVAVVAC